MPSRFDLKGLVKIAFASGSDDLNPCIIDEVAKFYPELPLLVVSEFPPHRGEWVPYHVRRTFRENMAALRAAVKGRRIRLAGVLLVPNMPYRRMRLMALVISPRGFLAYNEHLGSFMLRPRSAGAIARYIFWRAGNLIRWETQPGGLVYTWAWRARHPHEARVPLMATAARAAAALHGWKPAREISSRPDAPEPSGISIVIPSRNGRELLAAMLPPLLDEIQTFASEMIVVDNGSDDGTGDWLRANFPEIVIERSGTPLSFARAANRGIAAARYSHVCLLNNDMLVRPGFFVPLLNAFETVPDLFSATAQIFFPEGVRREETGKAVMRQLKRTDFPVRCDEPIAGEDLSYVLYGSGGCSLYAAAKLRALGGVNEIYEPAYVEDLDLGYRAWLRGWPTVFVAGAQVEHRHRATTSRYFTPQQLAGFVETNYLKFLAHAIGSRAVFRRLWKQAIDRLQLLGLEGDAGALGALPQAPRISLLPAKTSADAETEERILALTSGDVAVFPGRPSRGVPVVVVATPYLPFPLSHGGAVRMFNLISRAARERDPVLVAFCDELATPPRELLEFCSEIVLVRREGSHYRASTGRPDVVEEFDSRAFHAAVRQTVRKWRPAIAQLEFTQMAQYAGDCSPARTILVEHDITFDLQEQLLRGKDDWELRRQLERWRAFETAAWKNVDCVVTMSEKDRLIAGERARALPNGVDLERFRASKREPEPGRLLFIGSFAHLPNLLALDFFLREVWPLLPGGLTLHVIAGARHDYFLEYYNVPRLSGQILSEGIELEGFVSDVRPAYERAAVVIAPLVASAGTNIKVLEAMAMGKAIVSTNAGINGLDLSPGEDVSIADTPREFADAIVKLFGDPGERRRVESNAVKTAQARYNWDRIAERQDALYAELTKELTRLT